jgi:5'-nucleotidase
MKTLISNLDNLEKFKTKIMSEGWQSLHVLADFDRTLTYGAVNGVKTPSIISILRDGNHLTADYAEQAHALFNKYHPIEVDINISISEKKLAMQEWWEAHNKLLIESGLSKSDLEEVVTSDQIKFREGVVELLEFLRDQDIPLIIFSASGCGDVIEMFFESKSVNFKNISYLTNKFNWDESGRAISSVQPIIHSMNKDETLLESIPEIYQLIKDRKNVLLLGDSIGDLGMVTGFDYECLLTIGFLNFDYNQSRELYEEKFDIVLEGDGDAGFINELLMKLV